MRTCQGLYRGKTLSVFISSKRRHSRKLDLFGASSAVVTHTLNICCLYLKPQRISKKTSLVRLLSQNSGWDRDVGIQGVVSVLCRDQTSVALMACVPIMH